MDRSISTNGATQARPGTKSTGVIARGSLLAGRTSAH
jgi:hypothetical protein